MEEKKIESVKNTLKWKNVAFGGITGVALGSAGTLLASSIPATAAADGTSATEPSANQSTPSAAPIASKVTDEMSFGDAFNVARAEVGPGGVFEWHGNIYATYTAEEWGSMDAAAREQYASTVHWNGPTHEYVAHTTHHVTNSTTDTHPAEIHHASNAHSTSGTHNVDDPDVEIIGVEHANIDGEHDSIIGTASVGGQNVYFIDVDGQDDEFEVMVSDTNNNGRVDEGEAVDISQQHVSVSHFEELAHSGHNNTQEEEPVTYYANNSDLPDYVNDADPGTLA